jgi:hypothetical protein
MYGKLLVYTVEVPLLITQPRQLGNVNYVRKIVVTENLVEGE